MCAISIALRISYILVFVVPFWRPGIPNFMSFNDYILRATNFWCENSIWKLNRTSANFYRFETWNLRHLPSRLVTSTEQISTQRPGSYLNPKCKTTIFGWHLRVGWQWILDRSLAHNGEGELYIESWWATTSAGKSIGDRLFSNVVASFFANHVLWLRTLFF